MQTVQEVQLHSPPAQEPLQQLWQEQPPIMMIVVLVGVLR